MSKYSYKTLFLLDHLEVLLFTCFFELLIIIVVCQLLLYKAS